MAVVDTERTRVKDLADRLLARLSAAKRVAPDDVLREFSKDEQISRQEAERAFSFLVSTNRIRVLRDMTVENAAA
jgi:hypothetical protein